MDMQRSGLSLPHYPQHPAVVSPHPQEGSVPVSMPLMMAAAQPTPEFTVIAPNSQFKAQAPHSMRRSRSVRAARRTRPLSLFPSPSRGEGEG